MQLHRADAVYSIEGAPVLVAADAAASAPPGCAGNAAAHTSGPLWPAQGVFWLPLRIDAVAPDAGRMVLVAQLTGSVETCIHWPGGDSASKACLPPTERLGLTHRFDLAQTADWGQPAWLRISGTVLGPPDLRLGTRSTVVAQARRAELGFGIYYGILLAIALLSGVGYLSQRHRAYLWLSAFLLFFAAALVGVSGRGLGLLTQFPGTWAVRGPVIAAFLGIASLMGFAAAYLRLDRRRASWHRLLTCAVAAGMAGAILTLWMGHQMVVPAALLAFASVVAIAAVATLETLWGGTRGRYLLAATAILLSGLGLTAIHVLLGDFRAVGFALTLLLSGVVIMPGVLLFGVYRRFREMADERDQARSEMVAAQRLALLRAHYCRVTGLPRRNKLAEMFQSLTATAASDLRIGVYLVHIDNLSEIRQRHGRGALEELVTQVAGKLRDGLDPRQLLGRLEDWELVVIVPTEAGSDDFRNRLYTAAENITACLQEPLPIAGDQAQASISVGLAVWPEHGSGFDELIRRCDSALYDAQAEGGNRIRVYSESAFLERTNRWNRVSDLRGALDSNALELHYQPIHDAQTGAVEGFEALLRWRLDSGELMLPGDFIELAEDSDLIVDLGYWTLATAIEDLKWLRAQGFPRPFVSLNISPRQLAGDGFITQMRVLMDRAGLAPSRLHLEITEHRLIDNWERTRLMLRRIRAAGVRVYVDDFGVGYSSLSYLRDLPIQGLKIDRSFICHIGRTEQDEAVLSAVLRLADNLNLDIIAEGVETPYQLRFLQQRRCRLLQGHLYAKPMPRSTLIEYCRDPVVIAPWTERLSTQAAR